MTKYFLCCCLYIFFVFLFAGKAKRVKFDFRKINEKKNFQISIFISKSELIFKQSFIYNFLTLPKINL